MVPLILNIQEFQMHKNTQHVYSSVIWEGSSNFQSRLQWYCLNPINFLNINDTELHSE